MDADCPELIERIAEWRAQLERGDDPGPPPVPLPGLQRAYRAFRLSSGIRSERERTQRRGGSEMEAAVAAIAERAANRPVPLPTVARLATTQRPYDPVPIPRLPAFWSPHAVRGYRAWSVDSGRLVGVRMPWTTSEMEARCISGAGRRSSEPVPHTDGTCGSPPCGIYATKRPGPLIREFEFPNRRVYGVVALSGRVVEHAIGYRARRATAVALVAFLRNRMMRFSGAAVAEVFRDPYGAVGRAWDGGERVPRVDGHPRPEQMTSDALEEMADAAGFDRLSSGDW